MRQPATWAAGILSAIVVGVLGAGCEAETTNGTGDDTAVTETVSPVEPTQTTTSDARDTSRDGKEQAKQTPAPTGHDKENSDQRARRGKAATALDRLTVKGRAPMTGYDRDRFGPSWLDADHNGCDTRNDMLNKYLSDIRHESGTGGCKVLEGNLDDRYTGTTIHFVYGDGALVDIDHVVALGNGWVTGAFRWDITKRAAFANDPLNLLPTDAGANRSKGDGDAATWLPPNKSFRCAYVARQITVKRKYGLWVTPPEKAAMHRVLNRCPGQPLIKDSGAPTRVDQNLTDPGPDDPAPTPKPQQPTPRPDNGRGPCAPGYDPCVPPYPPDVDCADVDGPIRVTGEDAHGLDGNSDGVACG